MPESAVQLNQNKRVGGEHGRFFCSSRHPTLEDVWCRRLKGRADTPHDGNHAAFVFKISEAEEW